MPIFLTFLSACMAPPVEDPHPSPIQPTKPKPTSQHSSGEKDIFISRINLGPGKEDLTDDMKDYLLANDYDDSTQCLQVPLANDDNKITPDEAMKYTRVEDGAPLKIGDGPPLLADDFCTMFPGYYLDFTQGNIGTYGIAQDKEQSEEDVFSAIERGVTALLQPGILNTPTSPEIQERFTDAFVLLNEDIPGSVHLTVLNQMTFVFRDCKNLQESVGEDAVNVGFERMAKVGLFSNSFFDPMPAEYDVIESDGWMTGMQNDNGGGGLFLAILWAQYVLRSEDLAAVQDYCNHPEDIDQIMSTYFPDQ